MGGCVNSGAGASNPAAELKNREINKALMEERSKLGNEVKLLLLGAGESGKSTLAKQMKILHRDGFPAEERGSYKSIIVNNLIGSMRSLINAASELGIALKPENKKYSDQITSTDDYSIGDLTPEMSAAIAALWEDPGIKQVFLRSAEFQLNDSAKYYFENLQRISKSDYVPDEQDILRSRAKTTGIVETEFMIENFRFRLVDVGGQRSERKKWMHCFQDVTAVIFCVALSEYDLKLYEDENTNRMYESLKLFKDVCNSNWFSQVSMILFLNKKDIFEEKIKKVNLTVCFPSYTGGNDFNKAVEYIKQQFLDQNTNTQKAIYPHVTCATDTSNIQHVFDSVKETIIQNAIEHSGLRSRPGAEVTNAV